MTRSIHSLRFLLLALALLVYQGVTAETVFDPAGLAADWWAQFNPGEEISQEDLTTRVNQAVAAIQASVAAAPDRESLEPLVRRIEVGFERYLALHYETVPDIEALPVAQESYTLEEAVDRFDAWRSLKFQVEAEQQDQNWERSQLVTARKQQTRRRGDYLAMDIADSGKLAAGVNLIVRRLENEIRREALSIRKKQLGLAEERLTAMASELAAVAPRLQVGPDDLALQQKRRDDAQKKIEKLTRASERDANALTLAGESALVEDASLQSLNATQRSLNLAISEARLERTRLAEALFQLITDEAGVDADANRKLIAQTREASTDWQTLQEGSRRVVERIRQGITPELDEQSPGAAEKRQDLLDQLEKTGRLLSAQATSMARTEFVNGLLETRQNLADGWLVENLKLAEASVVGLWDGTKGWLSYSLVEINETPVTALGLIRVVLIIAVAMWLSRVIRRALKTLGERRDGVNLSAFYTLGRLIHYVLLIIGIVMGLSSIGIDFTKFALFASALGVGIGFGLQTLISNFVSGLIILFEKSLKVGDFVELESGVTGEVREINMRSTLITTNDNIDILVPNSEFVAGRVTNWTLREAYRRIHVPFGVAYGTDKDKVKRAALAAAEAVPHTLLNSQIRKPQVWMTEFADSSLNFELVIWLEPGAVKSPGAVQAAYLWELDTQLRIHGIEIPFPQQDLHVKSLFGLRDEKAQRVLLKEPEEDAAGPKPDPA